MSHIEVLRELHKRVKDCQDFHKNLGRDMDKDEIKNDKRLTKELISLSHAIKCCEIVAGLPSVGEIKKLIYANYDCRKIVFGKDLAQAIHDRIKG